MTEEQKRLFIEWLNNVVDLTKKLYELEHANIEGLDDWTVACGIEDYVHLNNKAFAYAIEALTPTIQEKTIVTSEKEYIQRDFDYKGMNVISIFNKE